MLNWKKQCSNIHGFNGLYEEMTSGNGLYILDDVQLPDTCGYAVCTIEFRYYDEHHVSIRCVEAPVNYSGSCLRSAAGFPPEPQTSTLLMT